MNRIFLFGLTNIAVLAVLSIVIRLTGLDSQVNINGLLIIALIFGMGGSFVSLLLSKPMAIKSMRCQVIKDPASSTERWLMQTIQKLARGAEIGMPDVAIFPSSDMNAFATGADRNHALVAVSSGLLYSMTEDEIEAVLGHEITHISNGDMVTMTLLQGVLNTFVIFFSRIVGSVVDRAVFRNERGTGIGYFITVIAAQIVFGLLASIIVMWFSRQREFRADAGSASLLGTTNPMIAALRRLGANSPQANLPDAIEVAGIYGTKGLNLSRLFMSHPPLEERIAALQQG